MGTGIICLETEWKHTKAGNKRSLDSEPLLTFIGKAFNCNTIYRRIATKAELQFYLNRFSLKAYENYSIFYLSFHGNTKAIQLEGDGEIKLCELSDLANGCFAGRYVHFSSCRTMLGSEQDLFRFKNDTGAKSISGYTKQVDCTLSAINDIAYFDQILKHSQRTDLAEHNMIKLYEGLGRELGFKII